MLLIDVNSGLRIPAVSNLLCNGDMEITEIRRRNLLVLEAEAESLAVLGEALRTAKQAAKPGPDAADYANYLSQIKGGSRDMGNKIARFLEGGMGKRRGWMDTPHFEMVDEAMEAKEAAQLAMSMKIEDREAWMKHGRLLAEQNPKKSDANPFGSIPKGGKRGRPKRSQGGTQ